MKVNAQISILELPMQFGGVRGILNLSLIDDPVEGLTLVDTGLPGQEGLIQDAIESEGFRFADLTKIVISHQDLDHVGSLYALKEMTNATVFAYAAEIPYIDGTLPPFKLPPPERLAENPEFADMLKGLKRASVDKALIENEVVPGAAGAVVIPTPGHTRGHISLYFPLTKTLIAGDALTSVNGKLAGPMAMATPDMDEAMKSVKKLAALDIETIICYHGGVVSENASPQLKTLVS